MPRNLYRNTLYWDAALKSKNLGISACIKRSFWPSLDYGFNVASKTEKFGLYSGTPQIAFMAVHGGKWSWVMRPKTTFPSFNHPYLLKYINNFWNNFIFGISIKFWVKLTKKIEHYVFFCYKAKNIYHFQVLGI